MSVCCQRSDKHNEVEWARRALQCLLVSALYHGEIKHVTHSFKPNQKAAKSKPKLETVPDQPTDGKALDGPNSDVEVSVEGLVVTEVSVSVASSDVKADVPCPDTDTVLLKEDVSNSQEDMSTDTALPQDDVRANVSTDKAPSQNDEVSDSQVDTAPPEDNVVSSQPGDKTPPKDNDSQPDMSTDMAPPKDLVSDIQADTSIEIEPHKSNVPDSQLEDTPSKVSTSDGPGTETLQENSSDKLAASSISPGNLQGSPTLGSLSADEVSTTNTALVTKLKEKLMAHAEGKGKKKLASLRRRKISASKTSLLLSSPIPKAPPTASSGQEEQREQAVLYQSLIISSSVSTSMLGSCQLPAEHKLQTLAQSVYESILSSLINSKPQLGEKAKSATSENDLELLGYETEGPFRKTMELLLNSIEYLLEEARQPQSSVDLVSTLQFWKELSSLFMKDKTKLIPPLSSEVAFNLLLESLLETSSKSPRLWQLGVSLMHISLFYLARYVAEASRTELEMKLGLVLVKLFSTNFSAQEVHSDVLELFLKYACTVNFQMRQGNGEWPGPNFLLDILITILEEG